LKFIRVLLIATLLLTGCGYFTAQPRLEECEDLVEQLEGHIEVGKELNRASLEYIKMLEDSLAKCQTSNNN
jgi:hypothetical protein